MSDSLRGALLAAIAALLGAVIGGFVSLEGTIVQLRHEDSSQVTQVRRSVYQEYLLAEENLMRQLPYLEPAPGTRVQLKFFLDNSKTWANAPTEWQKVVAEGGRISLYASDAVYKSVHKCTNAEGALAGDAQGWYEQVLTLSKSNPGAASSLAESVNTNLKAEVDRVGPVCEAVRTQMRSEIGIGH
jgi:hypothetical protein